MSRVDAASALVSAFGLHRLAGAARGPLVVMWHGIGGPDGIPPDDFDAQIELVARRRRIVSLADALSALGTPAARELAALTFDDGYVDFAELALPRIAARDLHATLFVPAGHVGGGNVWDAGRASPRKILDAGGLRALDPKHVEIGAHGYTHRRLAGLDAETLRLETAGAREALEAACARPVRLFAYPYGQLGDFDSAAESAVARAGFDGACSTHFGRESGPAERYRLRRLGIEPGDAPDAVARKLDGAYDWVAWKERAGARWRALRGRRAA